MWLAEQVCGDLADAVDRDLRSDRLTLDDLGWRGLWAYVVEAPPGTAVHYRRSQGWALGDKIAAEQLHAQRVIAWRYGARNFVDGAKVPFPEPISYPGIATVDPPADRTPRTLDELVPPHVRQLLAG